MIGLPEKNEMIGLCATLLSVVALVTPGVACAQDVAAELPSFGQTLLQTALSLGVVCLLAFVVLKFGLKRLLGARGGEVEQLELLSTLQVGRRRSVLLLRARDQVIVVGSSETGMQLLTVLEDDGEHVVGGLEAVLDDRGGDHAG